ncbi:MAG: ABC transporter permease [Bacilli bacterium]|nr:ABC transporter permease [Bacilli bacterium]
MKNILIILKKELKRFFTDRRMLLAMFLPGILIFIIYRAMGSLMGNVASSTEPENVTFRIAYTNNYGGSENKPKLLSYFNDYIESPANTNKNKADYTPISKDKVEEYTTQLKEGKIDLLIVYSDNFDTQVTTTNPNNNIDLFYNGKSSTSENLYSLINSFVGTAYNNYKVNIDAEGKPVVANVDPEQSSSMLQTIMAFVLPMVTVSLLYSTVISFCPESISGEKERGTLASILMTPIKKSEFVIGKIIALSIVAVASGVASFLGLIFSLPTMMGGANLGLTFGSTILLLLIMVTMLLFFVGLGVLVSAIANSVKEAGSYLGPLTLIFMVGSMVPMLLGSTPPIWLAFIPVANLSASITALLNTTSNMTLMLALTAISNIVYTGLLVFAVTKVFNNEKVLLGH